MTDVSAMTRDEFILQASLRGYSSKKIAKQFAGERDTFFEADFEDLFRYAEHMSYLDKVSNNIAVDAHAHKHIIGGGRTTKSYKVHNGHDG